MPNDKAPPTQLDIELNDLDRACRAIRELQSGKGSMQAARDALKKVPQGRMRSVAFATRSTLADLNSLVGD